MSRNRDDRQDFTNGDGDSGSKKPGMNMKKVFAISFCVVLGIVFISGGVIYKMGHDLYSSVNYVADEEVKTVETLPEEAVEETLSTEERTGRAVDDSELSSIHDLMSSLNVETKSDESIYNILLIGVDRQDTTWNGNSDAMILVSINRKNNKVSMVSLMRDTYVDIEGVGYAKLNAAYAYGAGPLLCQTVTDTYKIEVDRYVAVDFFDLSDIIDIIGGVDLEITAKEAVVVNGYIRDMCERLMDIDAEDHLLPEEGGMIHCDGVQAVAYARNRYVGNSDFERTQRQRYVLTQLAEEAKQLSIAEITEKTQAILEHITTNVPETEIWSLVSEVPELLEYKIEQIRIPYDNEYDIIYVKGQDMLVPYWETTLEKLQKQIYGDDSEEETETESETAVSEQ